MTLQPLTQEAITGLYHTQMIHDFPADELKPLGRLLSLFRQGLYPCYGLFEGEALAAYACLARTKEGRIPLLDYFAVLRGRRSEGIGSLFLRHLREGDLGCDGILLEVERVSAAKDADDRRTRERRIDFYRRGGCRETSIRSALFGVRFDLMYLPCRGDPGDDALYGALEGIYRTIFAQSFDRVARMERA